MDLASRVTEICAQTGVHRTLAEVSLVMAVLLRFNQFSAVFYEDTLKRQICLGMGLKCVLKGNCAE